MNNNLTETLFLLDRSGSMSGLENETIRGFNSFIENQRRFSGETKVSCILFDDVYEMLWSNKDIKNVCLTGEEYFVRGSTALLDAIGKTIVDTGNRLANTSEVIRPSKVIMVITTDGMENASSEFTYSKIKEMIKHQEKNYNWEFIFLGANINVEKETMKLGIHKRNAYAFDTTKEGVADMYTRVCESVSELRYVDDTKA
jgi:uncharacterized protein YegL